MAVFPLTVSLFLGKAQYLKTFNSRALTFIVLSGIAGAVSWLFYFLALKNGPAASVAAIDRLSVVFVLVFAILFLSENLTWKTGFGAMLVTLGAVLMGLR